MAFTKYNKVVHLKYAFRTATHYYIPRKYLKVPVKATEDDDPFVSPWGPRYKQCNTKWKMSRDKKEIYAICAHKIKFILDERK